MDNTHLIPAIEVQSLRKVYHDIVAVNDVSFKIQQSETFGLVGPNGAGKSTIVKIISSLVAPTQGAVYVMGHVASQRNHRGNIGYLPEIPTFHPWLSAQEFLTFHGRLYHLSTVFIKRRIPEVLATVGLSGKESQKLKTFSKGMLQRIGLAQALFHRPEILLLDELMTGLDPLGQRDMRSLLVQLKADGVTILLNSHQLADIEMFCDHVVILDHGKILKQGTIQSLSDPQSITLEIQINAVNRELLQRISSLALSVQQKQDDPCCLFVEVQSREQAADIAAIIQACGMRLYALVPHISSLEDVFFRALDAAHSQSY